MIKLAAVLLVWLFVLVANPVLANPLEIATRAESSGDLELAFDTYLSVLDDEPENLTALHRAAVLSLEFGMAELGLELSRSLAQIAGEQRRTDLVQLANDNISAVHSQYPDWVTSRLDAAAGYDGDTADVVAEWETLVAEANQSTDAGEAIATLETALLIAEETFGPRHWVTIVSQRDLGFVYRQVGLGAEAEQYYSDALAMAEEVLGASHPQTIEIVGLLADLYVAAGNPEQGVDMAEMAALAFADSLGADHTSTVESRLAVLDALESSGRFEEAINAALDLCADIVGAWGRLHEAHLSCLERQGGLQMTAGMLTEAAHTYLDISDVMSRSVAMVDDRVLNNLSQLGEIYRRQGRYDEGKKLLSGVIQLALQTANPGAAATAKSYLGRILNNLGDLDKALVVTKEVLDYGLEAWLDQPLNIYNTLLEMGAIYQGLGQLADAEATFEEAFAGLIEGYGELHPSTMVAATNLGQIYESIGLYDDAEPILEAAVRNFETALGESHPNTLRARNNLALLHESQGNFREAEPLYLQNLDLLLARFGEDYTDTIAVSNNLAFLYMLMEAYEDAVVMFEDVVERWTATLGPEHPNTLKAVNNLGRVLMRLDRLDEAMLWLQQALATRGESLGEDHVDTIRSMIDMSELMLLQGRDSSAEILVSDALARAEANLSEQHPYTFDALNLLIRIKQSRGDIDAAIQLGSEGIARRSVFLDRMLWTAGQNAREGFIRLHRPELDRYLSLLVQGGRADAGQHMINASLQRKGLLLKITSEIQQIARLSEDPAVANIVAELELARQELAALTLSGPTPETGARHTEVLYQLEQRVNDLQAELGRASVRYRTSIAQINVDTLETVLPDNSVLVDFLTYEVDGHSRLVAGVMVKEAGEVRYDLVNYDDLAAVQDAVIDYRSWIQDDLADEEDLLESGELAYDEIWAPLVDSLDGFEYVYLVPDGVLNILPFAALIDEDENYLIQRYDLHLLTSLRDLLPNQFRLADGDYVVVAGPDYDSEDVVPEEQIAAARGRRSTAMQLGIRGAGSGLRGLSFAPLPGAAEEGRIINEQIESRDEPNIVYFGAEAQEVVLAELPQPPEILHMATHGFFLEADENLRRRLLKPQRSADLHVPPPGDNPLLRSGLAFAGVNTNAQFLGDIDTVNDGVLTALEVLDLNLSGTQLVVLSACETGLGEIHEGEGVYGLRRSFQEAGVAEVISSLWEVSDAGTQALMTSFYDRLLDGTPARVALREAQLELMDSPQWGYPYVWSAFMIVGSYESAGFSIN